MHPSSKRVVEQQSDGTYIVRVKAAAEKGRANVARAFLERCLIIWLDLV